MSLGSTIALIKALAGGGGGGGGGGGLPSYTNDDLGKSLKLADSGETTTGTVTTILEQTITTRGDKVPASIQIVSAYPWNDGDTIHLVIDGESQDCVVESGLGGHGITASLSGGLSMIIVDTGDVYGFSGETYTISATKEVSVPVAAPAWVSGGSSGGGMMVVSVGANNVCDKTYNDVEAAVEAGMIVALKVPGLAPPNLPEFYYYSVGHFDQAHGVEVLFGGVSSPEQALISPTTTDPLVLIAP